ncbi:MAG: DnaJ domain-containing protein [Thermomicrobia bacterium]|nr:DnaJ domain-containing protein [Thermomicrobia bacterium]
MQVQPHAEGDAIQASYRRLALLYHPDRNPERRAWAEERMKRVNAAYAVLRDTHRRQTYDRRRFGTSVRPPSRPTTAPAATRSRAPYPTETENDWFHLHVYAQGRTVPEIEAAADATLQRDLAEFMRLVTPPGAGNIALIDLLNSAATGQYVAYTPYDQAIARLILRTVLPLLRDDARDGMPDSERLRRMIARVNDLVQDRMGTEGLKMVVKGKNIVADWSGLLLTVVNFLWGDA